METVEMVRFVALGACAALFTAFLFHQANGQAKEELGIDKIMKKLYGKQKDGSPGTHKAMTNELDGASPNWDTLAKSGKTFTEMAEALTKAKPEKGEAKSWEKLTKEHADMVKAVNAAVGKKDKEATLAALGKIKDNCETCHEHHRD
jgi:cytochrome c556